MAGILLIISSKVEKSLVLAVLRKTFAQNDFPGKFYYFGTNYERSFKRFAEHFFPKILPILELEVGFFSTKKKFFADFPKYGNFFPSKLYF